MSFSTWIRDLIFPKIVFVGHSELSKPTSPFIHRSGRKVTFNNSHLEALRELSKINDEISANSFNKHSAVSSADKRINELYHFGYAYSRPVKIHKKTLFLYRISQKGEEFLLNK